MKHRVELEPRNSVTISERQLRDMVHNVAYKLSLPNGIREFIQKRLEPVPAVYVEERETFWIFHVHIPERRPIDIYCTKFKKK